MKQVLQDRRGHTVVREVPRPDCAPGSVLVQSAFSAISPGTERARFELSQKSLLGKARERPDLVRQVIDRARREGIGSTFHAVRRRLEGETAVGYSSAGIVIEVGEHVRDIAPGDRVACAGGGHASHAEVISIPVNLCAKVPHNVGLDVAAMTTIGAIALHGVRLADVRVGERVSVVGCGLVGQIACRLAAAAGAQVYAVDVDRRRVDYALEHGAMLGAVGESAVEQILSGSGGIGMDSVIVTAAASTNDPLVLATAISRDRGAVVLVGDVPIEVPRAAFYDKELSFRVSRSYGPGRYDADYEERGLDYPIGYVRWTEKRNMEAVLDLESRGILELSDLIEDRVPVERAEEAYGRLVGPSDERPRGALLIAYDPAPADGTELAGSTAVLDSPWDAVRSSAAVSRPVRVALIGPGSFAARILVPALVAAGARLEAVAGGSGPSAEAAGRTLGFSRVFETEELAINDPEVDAVVIATRHESHARLTRGALETGKHVFCEKPLALTLGELDDVVQAASKGPGILAVGFNRRFSPLLRRLRDHIAVGGGPIAATYRVSAGQLPNDHWTHDLVQGGGRLIGECCHFVDSLSFVVDSPVVTVFASGFGAAERPLQARDNVAVTLSFENGSVGTILYVADGASSLPKERVEAFSGSRSAVLDDFRSVELLDERGRKSISTKSQDKGHRAEIAAFLRGVEQAVPPVALADIANVSLATLAIVESMRTAQPVRIGAMDHRA